jgi:hypothetical protein
VRSLAIKISNSRQPSLRGANGPRECAPDDRLRDEAIHLLSFIAAPKLDCFAEPVIGRRFAPTRWLAMTTKHNFAISPRVPREFYL